MKSLRERRQALGLTQRGLADILGSAPNTVARWERGELPIPAMADRFITMLEVQHASNAHRNVEVK